MNIVRVRVCLLAATLACLQVSAAHAYVVTGSSWPAPKTTFSVDVPGANGLWNTTFEDAMAQWSRDTVFVYSVKHQSGDPCSSPNTNPYVNGVAFSSEICGDAWGTGVVAVTATWSLSGVRKQAGIAFNSNRSWAVYSGPLQPDLDFRRVAVHELGHALGLGHEDVQPSIMRANVGNIEDPTADDIAGVNVLYDGFVPLPFAFVDRTNVALSTTITSAAVTITDITAPTVINVTGGTYSVGCTATFRSTASTISNNQAVCVRHTSAGANGTATNTVLTVGGIADTFTSTTLAVDTDGDGIADSSDNCSAVANPDQRDTNTDGFGNLCDADLDNDGFVNFTDLSLLKVRFTTADPDADLDGTGIVNFNDLALFKSLFGRPPGPSGLGP